MSCNITQQKLLLNVEEAAKLLGVSESWVRRHAAELCAVRLGRLLRFDASLLSTEFQNRIHSAKSLGSEGNIMPFRYQRGSVVKKGSAWYAVFREDINTDDGLKRAQKWVRLGSVTELPTKSAARGKLSGLMATRDSTPRTEMSFSDLTKRWEKAEGPTMKATTLSHYKNALRAYINPLFEKRQISSITREEIQLFLAQQAKTYSKSALRSMRVVLSLTLGWAVNCGWIEKNPCAEIRLPKETGGKTITRTALTPEQVNALAEGVHEPYATLILFLAATGLRIGEAIAVKWSDFNGNLLHVTRRIYDGDVDTVKTETSARKLPISIALMSRMRQLGNGEYIFRSEAGTPINPGNALKRYIRPVAKNLGIALGGWHDFRHSLTTQLRRGGVHPKVVSGILGHKRVNLAMDTYDRATVEDFQGPLAVIASGLLEGVRNTGATV